MNSSIAGNPICGEMKDYFSGGNLIGSCMFSVSAGLPATVPATAYGGLAR